MKNLYDSKDNNDVMRFNIVNLLGVLGSTAIGYSAYANEPNTEIIVDKAVDAVIGGTCALVFGILYFSSVTFVRTCRDILRDAQVVACQQDLFLSPEMHEVIPPTTQE